MSDNKLSSAEVPYKFTAWVLNIGCPPDKVPSVDKVTEMCRGQYYMVWRSLMEHVEPKDVIKQKRLQVFCDDMRRWKNKSSFDKIDTSLILPDELALWHKHNDVREKVTAAEERMEQAQRNLAQLLDKISNKLSHSNSSRQRVQDIQRRAWFLQQVALDLKAKKYKLEETKDIANSMCSVDENIDVKSKLESYISSSCRVGQPKPAGSTSLLAANPIASSSVVSANGDVSDAEEQLYSLVKCRGSALWPLLCQRRSELAATISNAAANNNTAYKGLDPQTVITHTTALHCTLGLEVNKNRIHIKRARDNFAAILTELNDCLSGKSCDLLIARCGHARASGRLASLRATLQDMASRRGDFWTGCDDKVHGTCTNKQIVAIDKAIESKKEELNRLVVLLETTEKKLKNVRECLSTLFAGFQSDLRINDRDRYKSHIGIPQESISAIRQFYEEMLEAKRNKVQLSMELDVSDYSLNEQSDSSPKFADELKIYLKKFNLEKNRKLVLESGNKIWIFESMDSAIRRLQSRCRDADTSCPILCSAVTLACNLRFITDNIRNKSILERVLKSIENVSKYNTSIDLSLRTTQDELADKTKKRLNDNTQSVQKTNKTLDIGRDNLQFWSNNEMRKHVSTKRLVDGKSYHDYELMYKDNISLL